MNTLKFAGPDYSGSWPIRENSVYLTLGAMARKHLVEIAAARQRLPNVEGDITYHNEWPLSGGGEEYLAGLHESRAALLVTGARNPAVIIGALCIATV